MQSSLKRLDAGVSGTWVSRLLYVGLAMSVVALFALVPGCPSAAPGPGAECADEGEACNVDADCCGDLVCVDDACAEAPVDLCEGVECPEGQECDPATGDCVPVDPCEGVVCDDEDLCTTDECDPATGDCVFTDVECPEGEVCDPETGECVEPECATDEECDDDDLCTTDACVGGLCVFTAVECPAGEVCDPETGECVPEEVPADDLEAGNPDVAFGDLTVGDTITLVAPDPTAGTASTRQPPEDCTCAWSVDPLTAGTFDPVDECTTEFTVEAAGDFVIMVTVTCDDVDYDYNQDATAACEEDADCDDDDLCTTDACVDGECENTPVECPEGEVCDPATGECVETECDTDDECDDEDLCTTDACVGGLCVNTPVECPEGQECDPETGECVEAVCETDADCDDGLYCNGIETCDIPEGETTGTCVDGERPCNDAEKVGEENATETCAEGDTAAICTPIPTECFLFTLGSDTLPGTAGDDCFTAELEFSPGAGAQVSQLQTGDSANGLAGDDTLDCKLNGTNATPTLSGIETLNFSVFDFDTTINCTNVSGATTINTVNSTNVLTLTSLQENVDFGLTNSSAAAVGTNIMAPTFASSVTSGASDSFTLTFDGVTVGMFTVTTQGTSGFESVDMVSSGTSDNILDTFDHAGNATLLTANFSGAANLQIKNLDPTILTVDASSMTGNLTLGDGNNVTDGYTDFAVNAMNNITGGEGDDFFIMDDAFTTADFNGATEQIDGGPGTDSLQARLVSVMGGVFPVANVENLYLYGRTAASSINLTGVSGIESVTIDHDATDTQNLTLLNISGTPLPSVAYRGDGKQTAQNYDTLFYTAGGVGGLGHSLAITVGNRGMALNASGTTNVHTLGALTVPGVEIFTLDVTDGPATITTGITATTATTFTFTASSNLTIPALVATASTIDSVNASGVTGNFVCATGTANWANPASITLGPGNDQFTLADNGLAANSTVIICGAGNDTFTSADDVSGDVINGGDGADLITGGGGADTITGGAGEDDFIYVAGSAGVVAAPGSATTHADTISDFTPGTDDIVVGGAANMLGAAIGAYTETVGASIVVANNDVIVVNAGATAAGVGFANSLAEVYALFGAGATALTTAGSMAANGNNAIIVTAQDATHSTGLCNIWYVEEANATAGITAADAVYLLGTIPVGTAATPATVTGSLATGDFL